MIGLLVMRTGMTMRGVIRTRHPSARQAHHEPGPGHAACMAFRAAGRLRNDRHQHVNVLTGRRRPIPAHVMHAHGHVVRARSHPWSPSSHQPGPPASGIHSQLTPSTGAAETSNPSKPHQPARSTPTQSTEWPRRRWGRALWPCSAADTVRAAYLMAVGLALAWDYARRRALCSFRGAEPARPPTPPDRVALFSHESAERRRAAGAAADSRRARGCRIRGDRGVVPALLMAGHLQPNLDTDSYAHPTLSYLADPVLASVPGRSATPAGSR